MAGILSKGITLGYKDAEAGDFTILTNLQEIPEIGNTSGEKIDVTVLTDDVRKSITGLGDSAQDLAFKFLHEKEQFTALGALDGSYKWQVTLPDGVTCEFDGTPSLRMDSAGVNAALTYTLTISVESEIAFA